MKKMKRILQSGLITLVAVVQIGCSSDRGLPACAPVSGTVTLDGEPFAFAMVTFYPQGEGNPGIAATDEGGSYHLSTYGTRDGAIVGSHVVTVVRDLPPEMRRTASDSAAAPRIYTSDKTTPLKFDVVKGSNKFDIALSSKQDAGK